MRTALVFLLFLIGNPAFATFAMLQWTGDRIVLATDSLSTKVYGRGEIQSVTACKIHQEGDIFFTIVGINNDDATKIDLVAITENAMSSFGSIILKENVLEKALAKPIRTLWQVVARNSVKAGLILDSGNGSAKFTFIMVSRRDHTAAVKEYTGLRNGSVQESPVSFYGSAPGLKPDIGVVLVGVYAEADAALSSNPRLKDLAIVPFMNALFQIQISHELDRLRNHALPRVGTPVSILQIVAGRAVWTPRQQQPCPDIKP